MQNEVNDQELSNESIKVKAQKRPGCMVRLEVSVEPHAIKAAHDKAAKTIRKEVSIPGFRKGKAPEDLVLRNFASEIERECRELVTQTAFREGISLAQLYPFAKNSVKRSEVKKFSLDNGAQFVFEYESEPQVPAIDVTSLTLPKVQQKEVLQKDIDIECKKLQVMHATWEDVTDRPVQVGDFVELDIDVIEHPAHNICINQLFSVEKNEIPAWIYDLIVGMMPNESREGIAQPEEDEAPRGEFGEQRDVSPKKCRVTLKTIKKASLPALDDELAKKVGPQTFAELLDLISKKLNEKEIRAAQEQARSDLCYELLNMYPIDVPNSIIEAETRGRLQLYKQTSDMKKGNLPLDPALEKKIAEDIEGVARRFFACMFLLRQVAPQAQVSVNQQEMIEELNHQTLYLAPEERLIWPGLQPEDIRNRLFMKIMMRKCADYLLEQSKQKSA